MRGAEGVVNTLFAAGKSSDAALLAQFRHPRFAAGQNFMTICLVAYIPHQAIIRCVENVVQRNGQFYRAEVRREMAAGGGDRFNNEFA